MSEDKSIPLVAIKNCSFACHLFNTQSSFSAQHLFFASVTASHQLQSSVKILKKKRYKWYLTIFFSWPNPLSTSSNIRDKEPLINIIDFLKKSSKSLTCNFLYYYLRFCTLTKNLNTERTLLKCNKTCCPVFLLAKIFVSFIKPLNVSLDEQPFPQSCKTSFLMMIASEQKILQQCFCLG